MMGIQITGFLQLYATGKLGMSGILELIKIVLGTDIQISF